VYFLHDLDPFPNTAQSVISAQDILGIAKKAKSKVCFYRVYLSHAIYNWACPAAIIKVTSAERK